MNNIKLTFFVPLFWNMQAFIRRSFIVDWTHGSVQITTDLGKTKKQQFLQQTEISDRFSVIKPPAWTYIFSYNFLSWEIKIPSFLDLE